MVDRQNFATKGDIKGLKGDIKRLEKAIAGNRKEIKRTIMGHRIDDHEKRISHLEATA